MEYVALGKAFLMVSRASFDAEEAENLDDKQVFEMINKAYEKGVNFFEIHSASPSNPLRYAFIDKRESVLLSFITKAWNGKELREDVENFLKIFKTDYIDIVHFDDLSFVPSKKDTSFIMDCVAELKAEGKIKYVGYSTDSITLAEEALESGLYASVRYPLHYVSNAQDIALVEQCKAAEVGFIASNPLRNGTIKNIPLAFGFLYQYETVVPVWKFSSETELQQILYFEEHPPKVDEQFLRDIEQEKALFFGV